jgi:hypothetical protein
MAWKGRSLTRCRLPEKSTTTTPKSTKPWRLLLCLLLRLLLHLLLLLLQHLLLLLLPLELIWSAN